MYHGERFWIPLLLALVLGVHIESLRISNINDNCIVPFGSHRHWHTFWPIVFNEQGNLLETSQVNGSESVVIPAGQSVFISCGPNYIKKLQRTEYVNVKCQRDGKFQVDSGSEPKDAADLACDLRSVQEILTEVDGCPAGKNAVKFGLVNPVDHKAYITGETCYDEVHGITIFAHVRKGDFASAALEITKSDVFKKPTPEPGYKVDFMKAFRLDEFNERLKDALYVKEVPEFSMTHFIDDRLMPNRQLYSTKKLAWNYFVIHDLVANYERLKQDISELNGVVDVYTGTHGVATLKNSAGLRVPIYLDEKRFPVPELIWFSVRNNNKVVGFAIFNDPFMNNDEVEKKSFCASDCNSISWLKRLKRNNQYSNVRDGLVLCCSLDEMKKNIPEIPQ